LDDIGINLSSQLVDAPTANASKPGVKEAQAEDLDLQARLDNLRKS
jgi:hypothetical protein